MAELLKINVLGLIENMSYFKCPCCGEKVDVFGKSHADKIVNDYNLRLLAKLPIDQDLQKLVDEGKVYNYNSDELDYVAKILDELEEHR